MQEKPLLVILLAVRVFAQLFIFDSQPTEGPIYFRLSTNGGAYGIGREAQLLGGAWGSCSGHLKQALLSGAPWAELSLRLPRPTSPPCLSPGTPALHQAVPQHQGPWNISPVPRSGLR